MSPPHTKIGYLTILNTRDKLRNKRLFSIKTRRIVKPTIAPMTKMGILVTTKIEAIVATTGAHTSRYNATSRCLPLLTRRGAAKNKGRA